MSSFLRQSTIKNTKSNYKNDTSRINITTNLSYSISTRNLLTSSLLSSSPTSSLSSIVSTTSSLLNDANINSFSSSSSTPSSRGINSSQTQRSYSSSSTSSNYQDNWFLNFNLKLKYHNGVYVIDDFALLNEFMNFYYHQRIDYSITYSNELFPYLHDPESVTPETLIKIEKLNLNNVIFIQTDDTKIETPRLLNTTTIENIPMRIDKSKMTDQLSYCRNFKNQVPIMATLSHFVTYNYSFKSNQKVNKILTDFVSKNAKQFIYSIEISSNWWDKLNDCYFDNNSDSDIYYNNTFLNVDHKSIPLNYPIRYLNIEQNLIWRIYKKKWICNNRICIGNIHEYQELKQSNTFKLFIHFHENCNLPTINSIQSIWQDYLSSGSDNINDYHLELPSIDFYQLDHISNKEMMIILNVLKLIERISRVNKIYFFCVDGYTASSVFTIAIFQLLMKKSLQESVIRLNQMGIKLYYNNSNFHFLTILENFIDFLKTYLIQEFPTIIPITSLDLYAINQQYLTYPTNKPYFDWFNISSVSDNNFPSRINHLNTFLGSVDHANSTTIIDSLNIEKIISIGEIPKWWSLLNKQVRFDFELTVASKIYHPIFVFGSGCRLYEVDFGDISIPIRYQRNIPPIQSFIYLHNLNDDGKDSLISLLIEAPSFIQDKILLGSLTSSNDQISLIHCKMGVSRSASILIASLMKKFRIGLMQAYFIIRVSRFNLIIQPNLKLFYELYMFQNYLGVLDQNQSLKKYNFEFMCDEIHKLNVHHTG